MRRRNSQQQYYAGANGVNVARVLRSMENITSGKDTGIKTSPTHKTIQVQTQHATVCTQRIAITAQRRSHRKRVCITQPKTDLFDTDNVATHNRQTTHCP